MAPVLTVVAPVMPLLVAMAVPTPCSSEETKEWLRRGRAKGQEDNLGEGSWAMTK